MSNLKSMSLNKIPSNKKEPTTAVPHGPEGAALVQPPGVSKEVVPVSVQT